MGDLEGVEVHPAARLFPLIEGPEFDALVADIAENGQRDPIVLTPDGAVLDGRNRWRACAKAGVTPVTRVETSEPWAYVISTNLHRRHLTVSQKAMVGARVATRPNGNHGASAKEKALPPSRADVSELLGIQDSSIDRARVVQKRGVPELGGLVEADRVSVAAAARVAELDEDEQRDFVRKVEAGGNPSRLAPPFRKTADAPHRREDVPASTGQRAQRRHQHVNAATLQRMVDTYEALELVLKGADGLDPSITNDEAARWAADLSKSAGSYRRILSLLKERKESQ